MKSRGDAVDPGFGNPYVFNDFFPLPVPVHVPDDPSPFSAIMDILRRLHVAANDDVQRAEKRLSEIVSMQTGLVKGLDTTER